MNYFQKTKNAKDLVDNFIFKNYARNGKNLGTQIAYLSGHRNKTVYLNVRGAASVTLYHVHSWPSLFLLLTSLCYVGSVTTYLSIIFNFTIYSSWEEVPEKKISFWAPPFQRKVQMRFIRSIILFSSLKKKKNTITQACVCSVTSNQKMSLSVLSSFR